MSREEASDGDAGRPKERVKKTKPLTQLHDVNIIQAALLTYSKVLRGQRNVGARNPLGVVEELMTKDVTSNSLVITVKTGKLSRSYGATAVKNALAAYADFLRGHKEQDTLTANTLLRVEELKQKEIVITSSLITIKLDI